MKSYRQQITAGVPLAMNVGGRMFYIQRASAGSVLSVTLYQGGSSQVVDNVGKGFKAEPVGGFDSFRINSPVDCLVDFVIADGNVQVNFDEETTIGNTDGQAIPIRTVVGQPLEVLFSGTLSPVLGVVNVDNNDAEAIPVRAQALMTIVDGAPVAVALVVTSVCNDPTLRKARFRNSSLDANIAIGGAAVTMESPIILGPGEVYFEDDAAGAHLYAIADAAGATLQIQGLK